MLFTMVPSHKDVSASATPERFVRVTIGQQTFQMHPGTAAELLHQLKAAHDSLLEVQYCQRGMFNPLGPGESVVFSTASA